MSGSGSYIGKTALFVKHKSNTNHTDKFKNHFNQLQYHAFILGQAKGETITDYIPILISYILF